MMENLLLNIAIRLWIVSGLWIVLGVLFYFWLRKWGKRFRELYEKLKEEFE